MSENAAELGFILGCQDQTKREKLHHRRCDVQKAREHRRTAQPRSSSRSRGPSRANREIGGQRNAAAPGRKDQKKTFSTNSMARGSVCMLVMRPKLQPA